MTRPKEIKATELFDAVNIELWGGAKFRLKEATRSVETAVEEQNEALAELDDDAKPEEGLALLGDLLDTILDPIVEEGQKKQKAKTIILREYKADKIGLSHVQALAQKLTEATLERPT